MKKITDITYGRMAHPAQKLDLYLPESDSFSVFIYFHGGGLEHGDKDCIQHIVESLTQQNIAVVSANYRMYPEAKYPEFVEDAAEAVAWTRAHIGEYGSCTGLFVGGSSAGGYLSMMLCFDRHYLADLGLDADAVDGYIHDAGQPTCHFNILRERGLDTRRVIIDESAPLFHIGMAESYPPMLFIVSDNDMENRYEQTMLTLSTLKHFQYDQSRIQLQVMHGTHCHYVSQDIFGEIIAGFIKERQK